MAAHELVRDVARDDRAGQDQFRFGPATTTTTTRVFQLRERKSCLAFGLCVTESEPSGRD